MANPLIITQEDKTKGTLNIPGLSTYDPTYVSSGLPVSSNQPAVGAQTAGGAQPYAKPAPSFSVGKSSPVVATSDEVKRKREDEARANVAEQSAQQEALRKARMDAEIAALKASAIPDTPAPKSPDYLKTYEELRSTGGVETIENNLLAIKDQKRQLQDSLLAEKQKLRGGVSQGFYEGVLSEEAQKVQDDLAKLSRAEAIATDQLNLKNSNIENVMRFTKMDYDEASRAWDAEYKQAMDMQSLIANVRGKYAAQEDRDQTMARANLTAMTNMFTSSGMTWDDVDATTKAQVRQMELRAGIPSGITESFARAKPRADIVTNVTGYDKNGDQFVDFFYRDPQSGNISQSRMYTGGKGSGSETMGSKLTLAEAKKYGIPTEMVGMYESEAIRSVGGPAPSWFTKKYGSKQDADAEWEKIRSRLTSSGSSQSSVDLNSMWEKLGE